VANLRADNSFSSSETDLWNSYICMVLHDFDSTEKYPKRKSL